MRRPPIPTFKQGALRGIYSEIARELKVTRQAIQQQARQGHADILARIAEKIEQRKRQRR